MSANDFVKWSDGDVTPSPEFWDAVRKWVDVTPRQALIEGIVEWSMATGHDSTLADAPDIADYGMKALAAAGYLDDSGLLSQLAEARRFVSEWHNEAVEAHLQRLKEQALCDRLADRLRNEWEDDSQVIADYDALRATERGETNA